MPRSTADADPQRRRLSQPELDVVMKEHARYLARRGGQRAKLRLCDLSNLDFSGRDLTEADLSGSKLYGARLVSTRLVDSNLYGADLRLADMQGSDISRADMARRLPCAAAILTEATRSNCDQCATGVIVTTVQRRGN